MEKLVSIIVPIYNVENYLKKCINSLVNQTYKNIEIILVDDGSTDSSCYICDEYKEKYSNIKVIHKKNEGVSIARNVGIDSSKGDYIFFIDSDDFIENNVIEDLVKNFVDVDIIKISYKIINKSKIKDISISKTFSKNEYLEAILYGSIGGHCWGYLFDRKIIKDLYFDKNTSCMEDTIFVISCVLRANKIKCINDSFYNHVINENGITSSSNKIERKIIDYMYSMDKIEELIKNQDYIEQCKLLKKRFCLIESEIAKIRNSQELKKILNNNLINNYLKELYESRYIKLIQKIYLNLLLNKKNTFIVLYIKIRRVLKKIKEGVK